MTCGITCSCLLVIEVYQVNLGKAKSRVKLIGYKEKVKGVNSRSQVLLVIISDQSIVIKLVSTMIITTNVS